MYRISNIKIRKNLNNKEILHYAVKQKKININDILDWHISKKSIDARKKDDVHYNYSIDISLKNENKYHHKLDKIKEISFPKICIKRNNRTIWICVI